MTRKDYKLIASAIKRMNEDCEICAGAGVLPVAHGDTSFSGDDPCPNCEG